MRITVDRRDVPVPGQDGISVPVWDVTVLHWPYDRNISQYLLGMTEHSMRDLEFALAQRRAMSKRCTAQDGEHSCGLDSEHGSWTVIHQCRACQEAWPVTGTEAADGPQ